MWLSRTQPAGSLTGVMSEPPDTDGAGAPAFAPLPRRRRTAAWLATALGVALIALVIVLARSEPATTRAADSPLLGKQVPNVRATTIDGSQFDLNDELGEWVVVNFFATWCVPCRTEHPELASWFERHEAIGDATVVAVVYDDDTSAVRRFRDEAGGDWPMLVDRNGAIAVDFGVAGVPESYLISPEGVIVSKIVGGIFDSELEELLQRAKQRQRAERP